jgi:ABC-type multidrug transport system permease subunit
MRNLIALRAFVRRDWQMARSYRASFLIGFLHPLGSLCLFYFVAKFVDSETDVTVPGLSGGYFGFVVFGLAILEIFDIGISSFAQGVRRDQVNGALESLLASPVPPFVAILGSSLYSFLIALLNGVVLVVAAIVVFGLRPEVSGTLVVALVVAVPAAVVLFACVGIAIAGVTLIIKQTAGLVGLVTLGMSLLCGFYYPTDVLPEPLQTIAEALPFTWALDAVRAGFLGGELDEVKLAVLCLLSVLAIPVAAYIWRRSLVRTNRDGSLGQY